MLNDESAAPSFSNNNGVFQGDDDGYQGQQQRQQQQVAASPTEMQYKEAYSGPQQNYNQNQSLGEAGFGNSSGGLGFIEH